MTKYKVNGGDKSERGDEVISLEVERKLAGNKGKHIEGQHIETSGSARERDWVVGLQILTERNNIINGHKIHPRDTDVKNAQDDTHLIYNSTSFHPLPYKKNNPGHHAPNPNHTPHIDDNAFAQQKPNPYELWSTSPPELLSSSLSNEDSKDYIVDHVGWVWMKISLPQKWVGRGEGELEMEGEWEMRGRMEEECPGLSSGTVIKLSGPEPAPKSGRQ